MPEISDEENKPDRSEEVLGRRDFMPLQVRTVRTWNGLESIRSAWERILHGAEALTIFSTLEWLGAWWKAFAKDKELVAPVFSNSEGEIVGCCSALCRLGRNYASLSSETIAIRRGWVGRLRQSRPDHPGRL